MEKLAGVIRDTVLSQNFHFCCLERSLRYDCETECCSFVDLIFAVLLHKFNHAIFEVLQPFPRYGENDKISKVGHVTLSRPPSDLILHFVR